MVLAKIFKVFYVAVLRFYTPNEVNFALSWQQSCRKHLVWSENIGGKIEKHIMISWFHDFHSEFHYYVKSWKIGIMKSWNLKWNREIMKSWNHNFTIRDLREILKYWNHEIAKLWIFKAWNREIIMWIREIVKLWSKCNNETMNCFVWNLEVECRRVSFIVKGTTINVTGV